MLLALSSSDMRMQVADKYLPLKEPCRRQHNLQVICQGRPIGQIGVDVIFSRKEGSWWRHSLVGDIPIFYFCMNFLSTKIVGFV